MNTLYKVVGFVVLAVLVSACSSISGDNMSNAAAWCADVEITGRWTSTDANGRYLGVSNAALLEKATMEDIILLVDRLCAEG
jgi:hypothetical protein